MQFIKSILFLCLSLLVAQSATAQSIANLLHGGGSRTWELRDIDWNDGSEKESQEFGNDKGFLNDDEATTIPETIVFNSNGTCSLSYVGYYNDTDGDDDEDLIDGDWVLSGTWRVSGSNVIITEENGYTWSLTGVHGVAGAEEEGETEGGEGETEEGEEAAGETKITEFEAGFDFGGFNSGIRSLGYFIDE